MGDKYKDFEKSKLQEMLSLSDEQLEQVTPDMKVKQIREMGKGREVPYYEMEGQMEFEMDFPEIMPEPELQAEPQVFEMDIADLVVADMEQQDKAEAVATSQQPEDTGVCLHRSQFQCTLAEKDKMTAGDGMDCVHSCCWECVKHGTCRLECYASAQRPKEQQNLEIAAEPLSAYETSEQEASPAVIDTEFEEIDRQQESPAVVKDYDRKILEEMIQKDQEILEMMRDYWEEHQSYTLTKYLMKVTAYQMLLKAKESEREDV